MGRWIWKLDLWLGQDPPRTGDNAEKWYKEVVGDGLWYANNLSVWFRYGCRVSKI